jgi:hypothetical protein
MPMMVNGAADSMRIAAILVYTLVISGLSASFMSARIRRRRKQIMEVTMMFNPTLSETHGIIRWVDPTKDELGKAVSTVVIIASTANQKKEEEQISDPTK